MKKIMVCLLAVMCIAALVAVLPVSAAEASGTCGDDVTWVLEDGVLTISGSGEITSIPWKDHETEIKELVVSNGVTSICDNAFEGCYALTVATFSESLEYIGEYAFNQCTGLEMLFFRGDMPEMNNFSFQDVTAVLYYPPNNSTWIDNGLATHNCTLYMVEGTAADSGVCGDDLTWHYSDGVLTISGSGEMYDYHNKSWMPWMGVRENIKKVKLPDGLTSIGASAFANCTNLTEITIPKKVQSIGPQAFLLCSSLKSIAIPEGVTLIDELTFQKCSALETVELPNSLKSIGMHAFNYCTSLKKLTIPSGVEEIWLYAFSNCDSLEEVWFLCDCPEWIDMIFSDTTTTAYYPEGNATWTEEKMQTTEGDITWIAYKPEECSHKEVTDEGKAATCTKDGLTDGKHCSVCGEVTVKQEKIPATGHSYGSWKTVKEPTTKSTGLAQRTCAGCGKVEEKTLDKLKESATEPTQTEPAETKPTESKPEETEPVETQPAETGVTEPAETETAVTEPVETQPAQTENAETEAETQPAAESEQADPTETEPLTDQDGGTPWGVIAAIAVVILGGGAAAAVFLIKKYKK